jgi:hypothetical protein
MAGSELQHGGLQASRLDLGRRLVGLGLGREGPTRTRMRRPVDDSITWV